jgi:hypothetical protein
MVTSLFSGSNAALLFVQPLQPILVTYYLGQCQYNPQPAKLLLFAEAAKLVSTIATPQIYRFQHHTAAAKGPFSKGHAGATATATATAAAAAAELNPVLQSTILAAFYSLSNNLSFHALALLPLHAYALLCNFKTFATAAFSVLLLQQKFTTHTKWSLLLLVGAIFVGTSASLLSSYESSSSTGSSGVLAAQQGFLVLLTQQHHHQQQQLGPPSWGLGIAVMLAAAGCSAAGSVYYERQCSGLLAAGGHAHHWHQARLYSWGVLLNGLWLWHSSSSSSSTPPAAASQGVDWGCSVPMTVAEGSMGVWHDMGLVHWVVVGILAAIGLLSGRLIRQQGSMCKLLVSSLAVLLVAGACHLLQPQPPLLWYLACCFAAAAVMQMQQQQQQQQHGLGGEKSAVLDSHLLSQPGSRTDSSYVLKIISWLLGAAGPSSSSSSGAVCLQQGVHASAVRLNSHTGAVDRLAGRSKSVMGFGVVPEWVSATGFSSQLLWWLMGVIDRLAAAAVLLSVLLLLTGALPSSSSSNAGEYLQEGQSSTFASSAAAAAATSLYNTTNEPMPKELVSMPCVDGTWLQRERFCPVINCSMAADCTVSNPNCCAHLNHHMLAYLDTTLTNWGLSQHYVIVYGTLLGKWSDRMWSSRNDRVACMAICCS